MSDRVFGASVVYHLQFYPVFHSDRRMAGIKPRRTVAYCSNL